MDMIDIQIQDSTYNWRTIVVTQNFSSQIRMQMENVQRQYPGLRVRAVDMNGRIIDIF